jgi:hypothetical protein
MEEIRFYLLTFGDGIVIHNLLALLREDPLPAYTQRDIFYCSVSEAQRPW